MTTFTFASAANANNNMMMPPPHTATIINDASATIKRSCDSLEDDSSFHSQEDNTAPNKRIKSSHHDHPGRYPQEQYRQPIQFVGVAPNSAFFTYGQQGATPFQRQP